MIVVDLSDEMLTVVVEIDCLLEETGRSGHILAQHVRVRVRIARVLTNMPKVSGAE